MANTFKLEYTCYHPLIGANSIFEKLRVCRLNKLQYSLIKDVLTKSASEVFYMYALRLHSMGAESKFTHAPISQYY